MEPRNQSAEIPQLPTPEFSGRSAKTAVPGGEYQQGAFINRNEQTERWLGHQVEATAQAPAQPAASMALPAPVLADPVQSDDGAIATGVTPLVAADDDLIEKEWVDKAKQVIATTKDDPFRREQEVKILQIDYVKKRYGKIIGATDE